MSTGHGEKVRWKSSWVEINPGRLLINYYHRQNRLSMGKISLSPTKNGARWWETKTKLRSSPPQPSSQAYSIPSFSTPSSPPCDDWENGDWSQCITAPVGCSFFTIFSAPACGPFHGIVLHKLFQHRPSHRVQSFRNRLQQQGSPTDHTSYQELLQRGLSTGCRAVPVAFPHSSLAVAAQYFLLFLKYILTEVPPAPLLSSALASSKWLCPAWGKPLSFLREATPAVPPATKTLAPTPNTRS